MNKKTKRWRALTAAVCIGISVLAGQVGAMPAAHAMGVTMDMRLTQTVAYTMFNFTPYRLDFTGGGEAEM